MTTNLAWIAGEDCNNPDGTCSNFWQKTDSPGFRVQAYTATEHPYPVPDGELVGDIPYDVAIRFGRWLQEQGLL